METTFTIHESRWGYHPCSVEMYQKIRFINSVYMKCKHLEAANNRWERKKNKIFYPKIRDNDGQVYRYGEPQPLSKPRTPLSLPSWDFDIGRQARKPMLKEQVKPLRLSNEKIEQIYMQCKEWANA